jgi:hypothetical protein
MLVMFSIFPLPFRVFFHIERFPVSNNTNNAAWCYRKDGVELFMVDA